MRSFAIGILVWLSSLFAPLVSGTPVNTSCYIPALPFPVTTTPCDDHIQTSFSAHRDFGNPDDLSSLAFSAGARAFSPLDGIVLVFRVDDHAFTLGPVRPGFAEITLEASMGNGERVATTLGGLNCAVGVGGDPSGCIINETVPILLGAPMGVTLEFVLPALFVDGPTVSEGNALIEIEGVRDASDNPVPIFAASQVPEPNQFPALCFALVSGALAVRRSSGVSRRKSTSRPAVA